MSRRTLRQEHERAEQWQQRLTLPVLVAALISVPAVFLSAIGGTLGLLGRALNWASLVVLSGEPLVLLLLSRDVRDWLYSHKWEMLLGALVVPAVVFAIGPLQLLRIALSVGTLRVFRVRRILRAGRVVVGQLHVSVWSRRGILAAAGLVAAGFLAIVLADSESRTRRVLGWIVERIGVVPTIFCGLAAAGILIVVVRQFSRSRLRRRIQDLLSRR